VDRELFEFLRSLDNKRIKDIFISHPKWKANRKKITGLLRQLISLGVLLQKSTSAEGHYHLDKTNSKIENLTWNATAKCNLNCPFCCNSDSVEPKIADPVSGKEIVSFLCELKPFLASKPSFFILGGEPLLAAENVFEVAKIAKKIGFSILLSTNGTVLTDEIAHASAKIGMKIQVSIDGPDADIHDAIRGKGTFERCLQGIRVLRKHGVYTIMSMVCRQDNLEYLQKYYELADFLRVQESRFIPLKRLGRALSGGFNPPSMVEMIGAAAKLFQSRQDLIYLTGSDFLSTLAGTCRISAKRLSCGTGKQTFLLDSDGAIYPCSNTANPNFRIASIRDRSFNFRDAWESNSALNEYRNKTRINSLNHQCAACFVKYWCLGGCRGEMFARTGDYRAIPDNCQDIIDAIIETMWLISKLSWLGKSRPNRC
jgi:radical SAM protein with 4Fe4S-binding SPASM domain